MPVFNRELCFAASPSPGRFASALSREGRGLALRTFFALSPRGRGRRRQVPGEGVHTQLFVTGCAA
jgi:hypothetical protein